MTIQEKVLYMYLNDGKVIRKIANELGISRSKTHRLLYRNKNNIKEIKQQAYYNKHKYRKGDKE